MSAPNLFAGMGGHQSARAATVEWMTPQSIIYALGGPESFDLDPATPPVQPWPTAKVRYTRADDGLLQPWFGRVWLNPPYDADEVGRWMARLAQHGRGCALIFARTETETFHPWVWKYATALLFLKGRLTFHHGDGRRARHNAGAPSVLVAYGVRDAEILAFAGLDGKFVPLIIPRSVFVDVVCGTWPDLLAEWFRARGPVPTSIDELYRALARHPKASKNLHVRAKLRQQLQLGPYVRIARGQWRTKA